MIDYKKIIKSRRVREEALKWLWFVPDRTMIKLQYRIKTGRKLNLSNAKRYSEKMQLYKLYYRNYDMRVVADKSTVKQYVDHQGYSDIIIPTIGIYKRAEEIDFNQLPVKFVAKDTLGGGGSSVIVCLDKNTLNKERFYKRVDAWTKRPSSYRVGGREWVYGGKHKIIIEEYLEHNETEGLIDYKFLCFNGKAEYLYVISNRVLGKTAELAIYDRFFNKVEAYRADEKAANYTIPKPQNYEEMVDIAEALASPFSYARVDLYNINGKIYFGEITLTDGSGYMTFNPDSFDFILGNKWMLESRGDIIK